MSRCFRFPSSGLSRKDASHIGSIKMLHNECENPKHGKEKNKGEKKNKIKNVEGKEKSKKRTKKLDELDYSAHKKIKLHHNEGSDIFESFRDWKNDASDQFERSGLTEEQEQPSSMPNSCNSLESTQNSSKKKRKKEKGLVLRIKLPVMKHKEPVTAHKTTTNIIQPSSAGKASSLKEKTLMKTPATENPCFSGRTTEALMINGVAAANFIPTSCGGGRGEMGKCFSDLILNWDPSSLLSYDVNPGSEDWLFAPPRRATHGNHNAMSCKPDHRVGSVPSSSMQPQACYLPEFDTYQLPYVIPF